MKAQYLSVILVCLGLCGCDRHPAELLSITHLPPEIVRKDKVRIEVAFNATKRASRRQIESVLSKTGGVCFLRGVDGRVQEKALQVVDVAECSTSDSRRIMLLRVEFDMQGVDGYWLKVNRGDFETEFGSEEQVIEIRN